MAVLALEIVAGEASCWIRHRWPDLIRGIREKRVPIFNEGAIRIVRDSGDSRRCPLGEIDVAALRDRAIKARYRGRGAQHRREQKEPRAFHSALCIEPGSPKLMSANAAMHFQIRPARASGSLAPPRAIILLHSLAPERSFMTRAGPKRTTAVRPIIPVPSAGWWLLTPSSGWDVSYSAAVRG